MKIISFFFIFSKIQQKFFYFFVDFLDVKYYLINRNRNNNLTKEANALHKKRTNGDVGRSVRKREDHDSTER